MAFNNISALTSPLSELQLSKLQQAMADLTPVQTAWVSGYLAGISQAPAPVETAVSSGQHLTILYGSQTGNSKGVAQQLADQAGIKGITHTLVSMADYKVKSIKDEKCRNTKFSEWDRRKCLLEPSDYFFQTSPNVVQR